MILIVLLGGIIAYAAQWLTTKITGSEALGFFIAGVVAVTLGIAMAKDWRRKVDNVDKRE